MPKQRPSKSEQVVCTPPILLDALKRRLGVKSFDIDAASCYTNSVTDHCFTEENDALTHSWTIGTSTCLHQVRDELPGHTRVLWSSSGQEKLDDFVVQGMSSGTLKGYYEESEVTRSSKGVGGKGQAQELPTRAEMEERKVLHRQPNTKSQEAESSVPVVQRRLGRMSESVAEPLRLLQPEETTNTRPFYSSQQPGVSGDSSLEYGPSLSRVQFSQRKEASKHVDAEQRSVCSYCGKTQTGWVFVNPPYANINLWVAKAAQEAWESSINIAMLVPASIGSNWWQEWVEPWAYQTFLNGRVTFVGHTSPYPKDCAILLYTPWGFTGHDIWRWKF